MDRWWIVAALLMVAVGCRGSQPSAGNPFDTRTRVVPPGTGSVGQGGSDPYLSGGAAQPPAPAPASWWPWSGGAASTGTASTPPALPNGGGMQPPSTSPGNGVWPNTWWPNGSTAPVAPTTQPAPSGWGAPAGTVPGTFTPGGYPSAYPGAVSSPTSQVTPPGAQQFTARTTPEPAVGIREPVGPPAVASAPRATTASGTSPDFSSRPGERIIEITRLPNAPLTR